MRTPYSEMRTPYSVSTHRREAWYTLVMIVSDTSWSGAQLGWMVCDIPQNELDDGTEARSVSRLLHCPLPAARCPRPAAQCPLPAARGPRPAARALCPLPCGSHWPVPSAARG
jgi:hypothetical protein